MRGVARLAVASVGALGLAGALSAARASEPSPDPAALARRWDHVNFEIADPARAETEADALERDAEALAKNHPGQPEPLIWEAAAVLAKADARRNLSSLPLAGRARRLLERAVAEGASGEEGAFAYAVLGTLYGEMPGFPLGFGDRDRARADFQKALAMAPANVEVNVLWGDFLLHHRDFADAEAAAKRALNAPARPGRPVGDRYRRQEAQALLAKAQRGEHRR
jgi:tetratricopeptide (TPR) repeat protein